MASMHSKMNTFLVGKESTFGTPVSTVKDLGLVQSVTPANKREYTKVRAAGSRAVQEIVAGKSEIGLDFEVFIQNGRIFELLFGTKDSSTETTGDWKHIFSVGTTVPSFTSEYSFNATTDAVFKSDGLKLNNGVISIDTGGILKFVGNATGQSITTSTSASASVISSLSVLAFKHLTLSTGTIDSESNVGKLQSFSFTYDQGNTPVDAAGTFEAQEIVEGDSDFTFEFSMMFEDLTQYALFLGGTTPQSQPTATGLEINANNGVTLGSGRREFNLQLTGVQYEEPGTPLTVGEVIIQTFRGSATSLGTNKCFVVDTVTSSAFF
jgi:hypothetical protein